MKRILSLWLVLVMMLCAAHALAYDQTAYGVENTPEEIVTYLENSRWAGWEVTGWVNPGTTNRHAAQAFVAVKQGNRNDLLAFRRNVKTNRFEYAWHNAAALPQTEENIELGMWGDAGGAPRFKSCYVVGGEIEEAACFWAQDEYGVWEIQNVHVFYLPKVMFIDASRDGVLHMSNDGWVAGQATDVKIYGRYQRDLRYFSFAAFPKTVADAKEKLSSPPEIPGGTLDAKEVKFTSGKKYKVFGGPGEHYGQAANGKAIVSTNDWIQVFGEENGYVMIQYDISRDRMRIGFIEEGALPKNAEVDELVYAPVEARAKYDESVTDDPLHSRSSIARLVEGEMVTWLATMGDWAYIEAEQNTPVRGFVEKDVLETEWHEKETE